MRAEAAIMTGVGEPLQIREVEVDPPLLGEVRVRMAASGVCHSDLHTLDGTMDYPLPTILGHEGAGIVEDVGPHVTNVRPGDHVMLSWVPYCGRCASCSGGHSNLCEDLAWSDSGTMRDGTVRFRLDGEPVRHYTTSSFSEVSVVPAQSCIKVSNDLPLKDLALMGCAVMTGVGAVTNTANVRPGQSVAVVGCGGVGLNVIQGAAIAGATKIIAIDIDDRALHLARGLGATHTYNAQSSDTVTEVVAVTEGGADHVFEVLGRTSTIELALGVTGRRGQTVLVGMAEPEARPTFDALSLTLQERVIRGCWYGSCRPSVDFPILIDLYRAGRIRLDTMTTSISLSDINEAFDLMRTGRAGRTVVEF
jgi:S-(hydroxymethyl)glutathione dehydrogenase/alcohol dehydrogenase